MTTQWPLTFTPFINLVSIQLAPELVKARLYWPNILSWWLIGVFQQGQQFNDQCWHTKLLNHQCYYFAQAKSIVLIVLSQQCQSDSW